MKPSHERGFSFIAKIALLAVDAAAFIARAAVRFSDRFRRRSGSSR